MARPVCISTPSAPRRSGRLLDERAMSPRLQQALAALNSGDEKAIHEATLLLAEVATFNRRGIESQIVPEANEEHLGWGELQVLERALIDFVERCPYSVNAGGAIWALGKFCDRDIIKIYRAWLRRYVEQLSPYAHPLGQLVACLSGLGEKVITGGGFSACEFGKNLDDAVAYLDRVEKRPAKGSSQ
jgi:hypothetical protein